MKNLKKDYILSLVSGPEKGTRYKIVSGEITIGRGTSCDVILKGDTSVSREHAKVLISSDSIKIENLSLKATFLINGKSLFHSGSLKDKDIFQLGKTKLQIRILSSSSSLASKPSAQSSAQLSTQSSSSLVTASPGLESSVHSSLATSSSSSSATNSSLSVSEKNKNFLHQSHESHQSDVSKLKEDFKTSSSQKKKKKIKFYAIVGILLLGFIIFMSSEKESNLTEDINVLTQKEIDLKIESHRKLAEAIDESYKKEGRNTFQYRDAQAHYIQGFRDYKKGQYKRAMVSFQTCLSLVQNHNMCQRYFILSKKRLNELIQYYMTQGKKYKDRYQFSACQVAFRNVMIMVQNRNSKIYKEAKGNHLICRKRWSHRF